jgi:hypothetical protein
MIQLAAAVWGMGLKEAIRKLRDLGAPIPKIEPQELEKYLAGKDKQRRVSELWQKAREQLAASDSTFLNNLRHRMGLSVSLSHERWQAGPGRLLGAAHFKQVNLVLYPGSLNQHGHTGNFFTGGRWGEVLMTPYYDRTDICGFAFCGRQCDCISHHTSMEGGLAGLHTVLEAKGMFGEFYIALDDPWLMLRLQLRNFTASGLPLPMVAWFDNGKRRTKNAWQSLSGKVPVFWVNDNKLTSATLHQAILTDGFISISRQQSFTPKALGHYIRNSAPRDIVKRIIKYALPWRKALNEWSKVASTGALEDCVHGLQDYGYDLVTMNLPTRIRRNLRVGCIEKVVAVGQQHYMVKAGRTYIRNSKGTTLIMNAVLHLDESYIENDQLWWKGRLVYDGQEIPFKREAKLMQASAVIELQKLTVEATGKTVFVDVPSAKLMNIAQAFKE